MPGKVALVTGGSSGIGRAAALRLAASGARVVVVARGEDRGRAVEHEAISLPGELVFVQGDVSRPEDVDRAVTLAVERWGRLDYAFNNAATVDGVFALTAEFAEDEYDRSMAVNLKSVWLCLRAEIRQMLAQVPRGGAIVNTSSVNGLGGARGASLYAAAKAGVLGLTKSAALEYAPLGIRVNALVAGAFGTPMLRGVIDRLAGEPANVSAVEAQYRQLIPSDRIGEPDEAAAAAVWLLSDDASYLTGHSLVVDGGMSAAFR